MQIFLDMYQAQMCPSSHSSFNAGLASRDVLSVLGDPLAKTVYHLKAADNVVQDGSAQSAASQDGDHLASEQAGMEEEPHGLQLPPAAVGEVEVAEVSPGSDTSGLPQH